jgi:MYXO-CTERM domain-containing protein
VQNSATLHFGLGAAERADRVEVRWPSGLVEAREDLEANRTIDWREGETPAGEAGDGEEDGGADDVATDGADAGDAGPSPPSSGCGCRLARPAGAHGLLWFGVAFLAGAVRRRRR